MVAGTFALQFSHLHLRRGAQGYPAATSRWLVGNGNILLAQLTPHLQNLRAGIQQDNNNKENQKHGDINRDEELNKEKESGESVIQSFYQYNDFVCISNNKWLRIFIPCR